MTFPQGAYGPDLFPNPAQSSATRGNANIDAAGGGGMSPGAMAALAGFGMLAGAGFDYVGQMQGASAMADASRRNTEMQEANGAARTAALDRTLSQMSPLARPARAQAGFQRRTGAINPALKAGGAALNMGTPAISQVGQALYPAQRVASHNEASTIGQNQLRQQMGQLSATMGGIDEAGQLNSSLNDQRISLAGRRGEGYRALGRGLGGASDLGMMYALYQPRAAA